MKLSNNYQWRSLFLLSISSFGAHYSRHALSMLGIYMIRDKFLTPFGLGILFSSISIPSMFLPLVIGCIVDKLRLIFSIGLLLLATTTFSELLLFLSLYQKSFLLTFISQLLFGCGATSFTTVQRCLISLNLKVGPCNSTL
jgi:hypothetical protein